MGRPGFEPGTNRLKAEYSTFELATQTGDVFFDTFVTISRIAFLRSLFTQIFEIFFPHYYKQNLLNISSKNT